jgi:hypothetical protein
MRLGVLLASLIVAVAAAPAAAQTRAPDLPPDLWEPLAPDRSADASSSAGLPLGIALATLALVAVVGFVVGDRLPIRRRDARLESCWIALWRSGPSAEFRAVVGRGAGRAIVGRSPVFQAPASGPIPDDGPARAAHAELVERLHSLGWEPAGDGDAWYQRRFELAAAVASVGDVGLRQRREASRPAVAHTGPDAARRAAAAAAADAPAKRGRRAATPLYSTAGSTTPGPTEPPDRNGPATRDTDPSPASAGLLGTGTPPSARALGQRARQTSDAGSADQPTSLRAVPPALQRTWTAEIEWLVSDASRFQIMARAESGERTLICQSPPLESPPSGAAAPHAMTAAVESLKNEMLDAGWKPLPPGRAWYAKRFAWSPARSGSSADVADGTAASARRRALAFSRAEARPEWPDGTERLWRCEIEWHAGYFSSRFRALAFSPGARHGRRIAASSAFRWLPIPEPSPYAAEHWTEAHRLGSRLTAAGWEQVGRGARWYSTRFVWRHERTPPRRLRRFSDAQPEV